MRFALASIGFIVAFTFTVFWVDFLVGATEKPTKTTLSDRVNAACPRGYVVSDWEIDGEFTDIPPETVRVTCVNPDKGSVIYRSVQR